MKFLWVGLILIACVWLNACVGATPMRQRTVGQQGPISEVDLTFIKNGETTRAQLLQNLQGIDTGVASEQFFLGRWRTSKWGAWAVGASYGGAAGSGGRIWHNANLLVKFNAQARVESYEVFPDKLMPEKLAPLVHEAKLSASEQMEVTIPCDIGCEVRAKLILSPESLEIAELTQIKPRKIFHYTIPAQQVTVVDIDRYQDQAGNLNTTLHFSSDLKQFQGPKGKHLHMQVSVPQLVKLLAYQSQRSSELSASHP